MSLDRSRLPHTFAAWFARFPRLTDVQQRAIPAILSGADVLICSATASGKTEAYAAPAVELIRRHRLSAMSVLIIAPTRALTNDLKRRLEGPMGLVDVTFGRCTGEHKECVGGKWPSIVVATPEAVDSLLARRPEVLRDVRMVILDEIHVLDNTPRGDQLRVLLHRLELVADARPQRVAASATVDQPEELARRYLTDAHVIVVPGLRKIEGRAFDGRTPACMAQHLDDLARHRLRKILVFCRSRNQVETYSSKLVNRTRFGAAVFAHHGSLAKGHRERTERLFLQAGAAVCFSTLTLEMGIDIGTVDYVLLADLPADVPSLLQRIGRGGRRGDTTRCGYVVENAAEHLLFRTMFMLGKGGHLCARPSGFRPSIVAQQAAVLACAETYIRTGDLERALPLAVLAELGPGACESILRKMVELQRLEMIGDGRYVPSESIEQRFKSGSLHSNIDDSPSLEVIDRLTGDVVGKIEGADSRRIEVGGRGRKIVRSTDERILTDASSGALPARFRPSGSPSVSFSLGRAVVESLGVQPGAVGLVAIDGVTMLLHGLGTMGVMLLADRLQEAARSTSIREQSPYTMTISGPPPALPACSEHALERFIQDHVAGLGKLLQMGPWKHAVPDELTLSAVRRMSGLDEVANLLGAGRIQVIEQLDDSTRAALVDL